MEIRNIHARRAEKQMFSQITDKQVLTQQGLSLSPSEMYSKVMAGQLHSAMVNVRLEDDSGNHDWDSKVDELELSAVYEHVQNSKKKVRENVLKATEEVANNNADSDVKNE